MENFAYISNCHQSTCQCSKMAFLRIRGKLLKAGKYKDKWIEKCKMFHSNTFLDNQHFHPYFQYRKIFLAPAGGSNLTLPYLKKVC